MKTEHVGGEKSSLIISKLTYIYSPSRLREFEKNQKINHFPASSELGNKEKLTLNIQEIKRLF